MTLCRHSFAALMLGLPLCAPALELRDQPMQGMVVVPMTALPSDPPEGRSSVPRLRDSLRQPLSDGDTAGKPYRLTPEERQRLREQLRGRPEEAARSQ
jgi:hypothetical protein